MACASTRRRLPGTARQESTRTTASPGGAVHVGHRGEIDRDRRCRRDPARGSSRGGPRERRIQRGGSYDPRSGRPPTLAERERYAGCLETWHGPSPRRAGYRRCRADRRRGGCADYGSVCRAASARVDDSVRLARCAEPRGLRAIRGRSAELGGAERRRRPGAGEASQKRVRRGEKGCQSGPMGCAFWAPCDDGQSSPYSEGASLMRRKTGSRQLALAPVGRQRWEVSDSPWGRSTKQKARSRFAPGHWALPIGERRSLCCALA